MGELLVGIRLSSLTAIAGFVIALWLGCYLATHTTRTRAARLATLTVLSLAGYFLHAVLCLHVPAVQAGFLWRRFLGWFAIPPFPLWFHLTTELLPSGLARRQRWLVPPVYSIAAVLIGLWLFGSWTFSTTSLVPLQLELPIGLFGGVVITVALGNLWYSQRRARAQMLGHRQRLLWIATLLGGAGGIYWPALVRATSLSWAPSRALALGEAVLVLGLLVLAYAVARHNAFMAGRWIMRDFVYHAFTIATVVGLFAATVIGAWRLAVALQFDVLTLILVAVAGLAIASHLLADQARSLWDALFFRDLRPLRMDLRTLARDMTTLAAPQEQMQETVERLAQLSGASMVCLALCEETGLVVKAATPKKWIGQVLSDVSLTSAPAGLTVPDGLARHGIARIEPLRVFDEEIGVLLLGEKGVGEGYDRQERLWIAALATHLAALLERAHLREEMTRQLTAIADEMREMEIQEATLQQEMEATLTLAAAARQINRQELREALRYCNDPGQLAELLERPGSTLATLPVVVESAPYCVETLQQILANAVDSLRPMEEVLPPLEALRDRPVRKKRRQQLCSTVADYYTLRLIMLGYTHEAVAEELNVSPRQVRNYLERAIIRLRQVLAADGQPSF